MSSTPSDKSDRDELRDRLLDAALREVVGRETPPDLSARILERANSKDSSQPTVAGAVEMAPKEMQAKRRRSPWLMGAIAATLLLGAGALLLPAINSDSETARRATTSVSGPQLPVPEPDEPAAAEKQYVSGLSVVDGSTSMSRGDAVPESPVQQGQEGVRLNVNSSGLAPPASAREASDFDSLVDVIQSDVGAETWDAHAGEPLQGNLNLRISQSQRLVGQQQGAQAPAAGKPTATESLMMMVTPHIIVQDGERDVLGVKAAQQQQGAASEYTVDTDQPFRQSTFGLGVAGEAGAPIAPVAPAQAESLAWHDARSRARGGQLAGNGAIPHWNRQNAGGWDGMYADAYGVDPGLSGDRYQRIEENPFKAISAANTDNRLSTFSIDVDTASYANVRQFLMQSNSLPPADAVRIEELVNYFDYDYTPPTGDVPFAANVEVASCPWTPEHRLVRIGIKGRKMERSKRPQSNLVFLVDVSGSMDEPNKLPLLVEGLRMLTGELGENDRVAIVVYASSEGLALESTRGTDQSKILAALDQLSAGGSTAGGAGIQLAYKVATDHFIKGGVNRVILCTDGDFNVGVTSPAELERMAEEKAKETGVFLTVLGFGRGNLNDAMMEQIADKGNGNYHYVDSRGEARKVLVEEMSGTLVTIAKDVKIQVEFNPANVAGYRLIGYENRVMAAEDFNDDKKDAGEIGAGHTVTALYEVVPAGKKVEAAGVDELKYAAPKEAESGDEDDADEGDEASDELLTLKIRYKEPDGDESTKLEFPVEDSNQKFAAASEDFKFASAVASFGMLLRDSQFKGNATLAAVAEIAESSKSRDRNGYRAEFVKMVKRAKELRGE
jgi:secreted protein with Ig-like and vWFA domain